EAGFCDRVFRAWEGDPARCVQAVSKALAVERSRPMDRPPALAAGLVQEFVGVAHSDLNRVTELLAQEPALIHATWDWGGGDWETALGAAAHMGRADIARFLLDKGARIDIFAAAMLGDLAIVQATLTAY